MTGPGFNVSYGGGATPLGGGTSYTRTGNTGGVDTSSLLSTTGTGDSYAFSSGGLNVGGTSPVSFGSLDASTLHPSTVALLQNPPDQFPQN